MKKTYLTSMNRDELNIQMDYLKSNYKNLYKELYPIRFVNNEKIRVGYARGMSYWKLDFQNHGEITVKRCMNFVDWLQIVSFAVIDVIVAFLLIYSGVTIASMVVLLGFMLFQVVPFYYMYVMSPLKKITRFVKKYLGIYE